MLITKKNFRDKHCCFNRQVVLYFEYQTINKNNILTVLVKCHLYKTYLPGSGSDKKNFRFLRNLIKSQKSKILGSS